MRRSPGGHLDAGQMLGHYQLLRMLDQHGEIEIWQGLHLHLHQPVALKILRLTGLQSEERAHCERRLQKEAQLMGRFHHPHLVGLRDYVLERNFLYIVMPYAPGGSLARYYPAGRKVALPLVRLYIWQIAHALSTLHRHGLIHRDVKPGNILLLNRHQTLLADFGLAMYNPDLTHPRKPDSSGTLAYMPPEQYYGHPGFASDQYSLATCAYEWLTGYRPFSGETAHTMYRRERFAPLSVRKVRPELPPGVDKILRTALHPDPTRRYPTVVEFANDFVNMTRFARPPRINRFPYDRRRSELDTEEYDQRLTSSLPLPILDRNLTGSRHGCLFLPAWE